LSFGVFVELVNAVQERCSGGVHLLFCSRVTMQKLNALWKSLSHFGVPLPSHLEKLPFKGGALRQSHKNFGRQNIEFDFENSGSSATKTAQYRIGPSRM